MSTLNHITFADGLTLLANLIDPRPAALPAEWVEVLRRVCGITEEEYNRLSLLPIELPFTPAPADVEPRIVEELRGIANGVGVWRDCYIFDNGDQETATRLERGGVALSLPDDRDLSATLHADGAAVDLNRAQVRALARLLADKGLAQWLDGEA